MKSRLENILNIVKNFFTHHLKMKLLVVYIILNLIYILVGSYIFMTRNIIEEFHIKEFSIGLKYLFIINIIVFLVILIKKKYKRNWSHLGIIFITVFRSDFYIFCI